MIDTTQIPGAQLNTLCATVLESVKAFYADPENMSRFNDWLAKRQPQPQEVKDGN